MLTNILQPNNKYILCVSGGIDSVVLLHSLFYSKPDKCDLIIAHVNHGIRMNSAADARFVTKLAQTYKLTLETTEANLGKNASEAKAREFRYRFFNDLKLKYQAKSIITAHHQDDYIETVILNFHRGCNRRGLTSLRSTEALMRPLLHYSKQDIINYAQKNQLEWVEDFSNNDLNYLRNRIRTLIMPKINEETRKELLNLCHKLEVINLNLDNFLDNYLTYKSHRRQNKVFSRDWFNLLDDYQASEIVATWLRKHQVPNYSRSQIEYIVVKLRTLQSGKVVIVSSWQAIRLTKRSICLEL